MCRRGIVVIFAMRRHDLFAAVRSRGAFLFKNFVFEQEKRTAWGCCPILGEGISFYGVCKTNVLGGCFTIHSIAPIHI